MRESSTQRSVWLNDVHSQANPTLVRRVETPSSLGELISAIRRIGEAGERLAVSGSRHAMGGQQFLSDGVVLDMRGMGRILDFDAERGLLRAEAGIEWPRLIAGYLKELGGVESARWGIRQKQTGADNFTLGGSLSANVHGRGLQMAPIVQDIESFILVMADGGARHCSRSENADLFALAIGGYGLFGVIAEVTLRLAPRRRVERIVEIAQAEDIPARFAERIAGGYLYGDFQFAIDETSPDFLRRGVFSCYRPTERPLTEYAPGLASEDWLRLLNLAYTDRARAFTEYAAYYLRTHGRVYWSDTHQLGPYLPDYAHRIQRATLASSPACLMITELYVPIERLPDFLAAAATLLRHRGIPTIYGTIRLIEADTETFLPWAKQRYACTIFNLLQPSPTIDDGGRSRDTFRALIDLALERDGNYYLTYHRHARPDQRNAGYPQFGQFLGLKRRHDPGELFQSDWYRAMR